MQPVLRFMGEGTLFSRIFVSALHVVAVLITIGALIGWRQLWKLVFDMSGAAILAGFLFQVFFVVGVYMVVHMLLIRAADVQAIGKSEFTMIPIVAIFLKMLGEVYACISTGPSLTVKFLGTDDKGRVKMSAKKTSVDCYELLSRDNRIAQQHAPGNSYTPSR